jgi:hypothetical protein
VNVTTVNALDRWFSEKGSSLIGINLPSGTIPGVFAWASQGFSASSFDTSRTFNVGGQQFSSLGTVLRGWGINKLFGWSDKALGMSAGSTFQIYDAANKVFQAQRGLQMAQSLSKNLAPVLKAFGVSPENLVKQAKANMAAAQAALISTVINMAFASEIGSAEKAIGLVPGTGGLAVTLLVQLAMGVPVDPVTLGLFIAINLFGVYRVDIYQRGTADGYYPFVGQYGVARQGAGEAISSDYQLGEFDVKDTTAYHQGLRDGARAKVKGVLTDLLTMPERWGNVTGDDPNLLWISQIYTGRSQDIGDLDYIISQPAPWDNPAGLGYGLLKDRADLTLDSKSGQYIAQPKAGYRSGVFANDVFNDHLHLRW